MEQQNRYGRVRAEVKFPLILIHTPFGLGFFDKIAKTRAAEVYARFSTYLMPAITALAIFLILGSLILLVGSSEARQGAANVGPTANLLIPGLNQYIPWTYGWLGLVITIIIHEAGHGIIARVYNIRVDSTGIVLLGPLPIGAFVNIERDELNRATLKQKSAVLTAGPLNNMILAVASLLALYLLVSTLTPIQLNTNTPQFGVTVVGVNSGSLAEKIGLKPESVIQYIGSQQIKSSEDLHTSLISNLGKTVDIKSIDASGKTITHSVTLPSTQEPGKGILGINVVPMVLDPQTVLNKYKDAFKQNPLAVLLPPTMGPYSVPFSDQMASNYGSSALGPAFAPVANTLFWLWFINFNVGIFNALPIWVFDGGQLYSSLIERKARSKALARNASTILTAVMAGIVIVAFALPYISELFSGL